MVLRILLRMQIGWFDNLVEVAEYLFTVARHQKVSLSLGTFDDIRSELLFKKT